MGFGSDIAFSEDATLSLGQTGEDPKVIIKMESYTFTPRTIIAEVGKPIQLVLQNESFLIPHNFLLDSPDGIRLVEMSVDSGEEAILPFTPTGVGVYVFYCDKKFLFFPNHRE